jgi:peroxiredoxin
VIHSTRSLKKKSVVLLGGLAMLLPGLCQALEPGDRAPDFAAPALSGQGTVELSRYRGKVVYLDFWASWCAPCLKAIPEIEEMRGEFPSDAFQIVAVNLDQKQAKALRFLEKHPIGYPSASDPKGRLPEQFGLETMPTSYLIDAEGVIQYVHRGFKRGDGSKLRHEIRALLERQ